MVNIKAGQVKGNACVKPNQSITEPPIAGRITEQKGTTIWVEQTQHRTELTTAGSITQQEGDLLASEKFFLAVPNDECRTGF